MGFQCTKPPPCGPERLQQIPRLTFNVLDRRHLEKEKIFYHESLLGLLLDSFRHHRHCLETGNVSNCCVFISHECKKKFVYKYIHYANMSVQYTAIFHGCENGNFQMRKCHILLTFAQNIDRGYTLEPPQ